MRAAVRVRPRTEPTYMEPPDGWRLLAAAFCSAAAALQQLEPTAFLAAQQQHNQQHEPTAWCCCNHRCAEELPRQQLRSAMDQSKADYDTRLYDVCRPWRGKRGDAYSVTFRPAFLNGLLKFTDDWSSLREHALGTDYGGPAGPPHPGGASGLTSLRAWGNRAQKLRHKVWLHCEDEAVRAMIDEACDQLAAHLAGGAAAPAAPSLWLAGCSQGQLALAVLDSAGTHPDTGLSVSLRNKKWEGLSPVSYTHLTLPTNREV